MVSSQHYFWAIRLPDDMKQYIQSELSKVKEKFPFKRWVHEQDYHITLAFLGSVDQERLNLSQRLIEEAISEAPVFSLSLNRLGVFGKMSLPRIFWAGVEKENRLYTIQSQVFKACSKAGFSLEARPFSPHITLARNWNGSLFEKELLETYNPFSHNEISFLQKEVVLYKTNIKNTPKYEAITNFLLKSE